MPVTYTFYRSPDGGFPGTISDFAYTNEFYYMARPLSSADFPGDNTYYIQNVWTNQQTGYVLQLWYMAVVSGTSVAVYIQDSSGNFTVPDPLYMSGIMNAGFQAFPALDPQDFMVANAPGGYVVTENFCTAYLGTPYQTLTVPNQMDLRMLALEVVAASPPIFNPLAIPDPGYSKQTNISGNWMALPVSTANYPTGWTPSGPISWTLPIAYGYGSGTTIVQTLSGTSPVSGTGVVGTLSTSWNGTNTAGKYLEGFFYFAAYATVAVASNTIATYPMDPYDVVVCRCPNRPGPCSIRGATTKMIGNPVGPSIETGVAYSSMFATGLPASMGYGWCNIANIRLYEDASSNVFYKDEYGVYLSWNYNSATGTYTPSTGNNYVKLTTSGSFPNYTLTFPDQTKRLFNNASPPQLINEVDPRGQTTTYTYTGGHLTQVTDAKGRNLYYTNNADGQVASIRAINSTTGHQTQFNYWPNTDPVAPNRLKEVITPAGDTTVYYYTLAIIGGVSQPVITSIVDPTGKTAMQYAYDGLGRVVQEQWYDQKLTTYTYDTAFVVDPSTNTLMPVEANAVTTEVVDLTGNSPYQLSTAYYDEFFNVVRFDELVDVTANPIVVNSTYNTYGDSVNPNLLTLTIDPNLNPTSMTYDSMAGNLLTYTDAYSSVTTITYNAASQPLTIQRPTVTVPGSGPVTYLPTVMTYDGSFNLTKIEDSMTKVTVITPNSDGTIQSIQDTNLKTTSFTYYSNGNLETVTLPAHSGDTAPRVTTLGYDTYDNVSSVANALSDTLQIQSDADRRTIEMTQPLLQNTLIIYGTGTTAGLITKIQFPDNQGSGGDPRNLYYSTYDSANRVIEVQQDIALSTPLMRVQMLYDGFSNLIQQTRQQTSGGSLSSYNWSFDQLGRLVGQTDPLGALSSTLFAPYCMSNQFTSARGVQRISTYDNLCRLTEISTQTEKRLYGWDELSRLVSDLNGGRYAWEIEPGVMVGAEYGEAVYANGRTYTRDPLDRVTQVTYTDGSYETYTWDPVGNLLTMRDIFGQVTTYTYFPDNLLETASITYGGTTYTFTYAWDLAGRLETLTFPGTTGIVLSFTTATGATGWDANGRLISMRYLGATTQSFAYSYDNSGNRTGLVDVSSAGTVTWAYGYDWLDRLTTVTKNGSLVATYSYDNSDNRTKLVQGSNTYTYQVDNADQLSTKMLNGALFESYVPDADGNMISRTLAAGSVTTNYIWNDFNNLLGFAPSGTLQETDFYDTDGIRRLRSDGTKYTTAGGVSLAEQRPTSGQVSFIRGHQLLGLQEGGSVYFYLTDGLSSVRQVVNSSGTSVATFATDEFGVPTSSGGSPELLAHTYVGGLGVRNETGTPSGAGPVSNRGLYYMQQRWMDPVNGRFLNRDPIGFDGGLNLFSYVSNNPTNFVDSSGLDQIRAFGVNCSQIKAAVKGTNVPAWALGALLVLESGTHGRFGIVKPIAEALGVDGSVWPTATRLSYDAYLDGRFGNLQAAQFFTLSDTEKRNMYGEFVDYGQHLNYFRELQDVNSNLNVAARSLDAIAASGIVPSPYSNEEFWLHVVAVHSQAGDSPNGSAWPTLHKDGIWGKWEQIFNKTCSCP